MSGLVVSVAEEGLVLGQPSEIGRQSRLQAGSGCMAGSWSSVTDRHSSSCWKGPHSPRPHERAAPPASQSDGTCLPFPSAVGGTKGSFGVRGWLPRSRPRDESWCTSDSAGRRSEEEQVRGWGTRTAATWSMLLASSGRGQGPCWAPYSAKASPDSRSVPSAKGEKLR